MLPELFYNKLFLALFVSMTLTQFIKIFLLITKDKQPFYFKDLFVTGGMPSAHSALVTSLAVSIYISEGLSTLFFMSVAFALIVIRDALGVRRTAGEEGKVLNEVIKRSKLKIPKVHYSLGHKPEEVLVGMFIGILVSVVVFSL